MRWLFQFSLFISFFLTSIVYADQLIIEPDAGRAPILQTINNTNHSLQLVMYGFTDATLLQALVKQKQTNKTIQIILEETPYKADDENLKAIASIKKYGIDWHGKVPPFRLIHQKTLLVDGSKALIMTFNFTQSTFKNQRNFGLIIDDPREIREIANVFSSDWNHASVTPDHPNLVWSPDNSRERILNLIQSAKQSIQIYAQDINDYKIVGALAKAARKGVTVNILTSKHLRDKQANYLANAHVNVHRSKLYIHAKVMIIDQRKALIGSINFTRASLDNNRELSIIAEDKNVIKQLTSVFNQDWKADSEPFAIKKILPDNRTINYILRRAQRYLHHYLKSQ